MAAVELYNVSHAFDKKSIFSDVSHSFAINSVTAILGKSGSGKSTLLQIINGIIRPQSGHVKLFSTAIKYEHIVSLRLQMGYMVQQVGLFPHLTIQENIGLLGRITKQDRSRLIERTDYLMDMVQLPFGYKKKYPYELSGGEQQRVGICRAMFIKPKILLMDEAFGFLDEETKQSIYLHFKAIQKNEPCTILMVTHDYREALILASHFVKIENGKINESTREEIEFKAAALSNHE